MNTANMAEGAKERASQELAKQYSATAEQSRANLAETQTNIVSQYSNLYSKWEENLKATAQEYAEKEETLWDMADALGYTEYTEEDLANNRGSWYKKYYDTEGITQEGKDILERVIYGQTYFDPNADNGKGKDVARTFTDDITEQYPELKEWFMEHMGDVNEMMLGRERNYNPGTSYSWENRDSITAKATELEQKAKLAGFDISKEFKNQTEKADYYETVNAILPAVTDIKTALDAKKEYEENVKQKVNELVNDETSYKSYSEYMSTKNNPYNLEKKKRELLNKAKDLVDKTKYNKASDKMKESLVKTQEENGKFIEDHQNTINTILKDMDIDYNDFKSKL